MISHVELIKPSEKLSLGPHNSGYLPPSTPASLSELADAVRAGQIVWKVARSSVNWNRPANYRLLDLGNVRIKCSNPVGSTRDWYFVWVCD